MHRANEAGYAGAIFIIVFLVVLGTAGYYLYHEAQKDTSIDSFAECVAAGNPVMESYPEQCNADGKTFVNTIDSYESCISAGNPMLKSDPPRCEVNGQYFTEGE